MSREPGPELAGVVALLRGTYGLDPYRGGMIRTLIRHHEARMEALGVSAEVYLERVTHDLEERARLVRAMTVNHSWFFRDPKQLEALGERMGDLHRAAAGRPLELWVAGCATGQEAWTMAMIAKQLRLPARILATDIDAGAIAEANTGEYGAWSLRELPQPLWAYLEQLSPERWVVRDELRAMVRFLEHNLCEPCPDQLFDVISCRNVLIYFDAPRAHDAVTRMRARLRPDGELVLGAGDLMFQPRVSGLPARVAAAGGKTKRPPEAAVERRPPPPPPRSPPSRSRLDARMVVPELPPAPAPSGPSRSPLRARVEAELAKPASLKNDPLLRELDRAGRDVSAGIIDEALEVLEVLINEDPLLAEAHLWVGIAHHTRGDDRPAGEALRRARCLEPQLWPGTLFAALNAERRGRWEAAARCWSELDRLMNTPNAPSIEGTAALLDALPTWRAEAIGLARQRNSKAVRGNLSVGRDRSHD